MDRLGSETGWVWPRVTRTPQTSTVQDKLAPASKEKELVF